MAIKKLVAISYCLIFLALYFCSIAYALLSTSINDAYEIALPQTIAMNATSTAISSISSWGGVLVIIGIVALIITILSIITGSRAMSSAI